MSELSDNLDVNDQSDPQDEAVLWVKSILALPKMDYDLEDPKKVWSQEAFELFTSEPMPNSVRDELFRNVNTQTVTINSELNPFEIVTIDEYKKDASSYTTMLVSLYFNPDFSEEMDLPEEVNEAIAEAVAVTFDQLSIAGDGIGKMLGMVPPLELAPDSEDTDEDKARRQNVLSKVSFFDLEANQIELTVSDLRKIRNAYLDILGLKIDSPEGQQAIKDAYWIMNSNTGLNIAEIKNADGTYWMDHDDGALKTVGVPDTLLDSTIIYNEYMDDLDNRPRSSGHTPPPDTTPLIYGNIKGVYLTKIGPDIIARHYKPKKDEEPNKEGMIFGLRLKGEVDFSKAINDKLPYVALRTHLAPRTAEEIAALEAEREALNAKFMEDLRNGKYSFKKSEKYQETEGPLQKDKWPGEE